ncbi:MAG TPA: hypothetical protein VGY54_26930, partial [Polyangiaceae bacterium]|nr:hypothetical protein [Polyangiaceae bacterium]
MRSELVFYFMLIVALAACSSGPPGGSKKVDTTSPGETVTASVPSPLTAHPACVISADCPSGQHCDLQQCVQDCNSMAPCAGNLTCSPRARCVAPGVPDTDPASTGKSAGVLSASPSRVLLTDRDSSFTVALTSSGTSTVRYRVEVSGPHLSVAHPAGTFAGSTQLVVNVDPTAASGRNQSGTLTIYSSLGTTVVSAPIHAGITGSYRGKLHYDGGPINLGGFEIALDVIEKAGAVQLRVIAQASMLFPAIDAQAATGQGIFVESTGLDATVAQVFNAAFGGPRNPFQRDIGRQVRFQLLPNSVGGLDGTFSETLVGLFANPITTSGHIALQYVPGDSDPTFSLGKVPTMPASPDKASAYALNDVLNFSDPTPCESVDLLNYDGTYATPSLESFANQTSSSVKGTSYDDIATACQNAMQLTSVPDPTGATAPACGLPQELAYALTCGAKRVSPSNVAQAKIVGRLLQDTLTAPLLVAKNEVVNALRRSFTDGPSAELSHYDAAITALTPYARWVLQPAVVEFVRSMAPQAASGDASSNQQTQGQPYPTARALADLFRLMASIDAERTRVDGAMNANGQSAHDNAQQRALLSYLELASLAEILKQWGTAPDSIVSSFTGALTPLDNGFAGLLKGANAFGIPDGFVPFVYRPEQASASPTNFEQVLAIAQSAVVAEKADETNFVTDDRSYAAQVQQLHSELMNVKAQYDTQLLALCGASFNPDKIKSTSDDWSSCGANHSGAVGQAVLGTSLARAQLTAAQAGICGQGKKLQADVEALAQMDEVETATIKAIWDDGREIAANDLKIGVIDAAQTALSIAANAQVWNGGAPAAEAACALIA